MKIKSIVIALSMVVSSQAFAEVKFVEGVVPHYYEFDYTYNNHSVQRWYCGHATLKMVAEYITERNNDYSEVSQWTIYTKYLFIILQMVMFKIINMDHKSITDGVLAY